MEARKDQQNPEEEQLNLDELLNVEGGISNEDKDVVAHCGLGCFSGGLNTGGQDLKENDNP